MAKTMVTLMKFKILSESGCCLKVISASNHQCGYFISHHSELVEERKFDITFTKLTNETLRN